MYVYVSDLHKYAKFEVRSLEVDGIQLPRFDGSQENKQTGDA